jgi:hypothetical protein
MNNEEDASKIAEIKRTAKLLDTFDKRTNKWVVSIKGKVESQDFEVSVLRDDNKHGKLSYGWFGDNKLLIIQHGCGAYGIRITSPLIRKIVLDKSVKFAQELADELNFSELHGSIANSCNSFCGDLECNMNQEINPNICKRIRSR